MKNPMEVLRMKEQELLRVKKEVEALHIAARLLSEEASAAAASGGGQKDIRQLVEMP